MMSGTTIDTPIGTMSAPMPLSCDQAVAAGYPSHYDAEMAIRLLAKNGLAMDKISIIGRNFQTREDVQGFYRPADAAREGAQAGAWFGGLFGLMLGTGLFVLPVIGSVLVLGPFAGLIAGAIGGAGVGALISGLVSLGVPPDQAIKYQERIQAGEFLVVVHGASTAETEHACSLLQGTNETCLQTHCIFHGGVVTSDEGRPA
jgi:hypothetical protein